MFTLLWVKAGLECEGCGRPFSVFLDPGDLQAGMDLHDLTREAVMNGNRSADANPLAGIELTAVVAGLCLCPRCRSVADAIETPDDKDPTRSELESALLGAAVGKRK